MEWEIIEQMLDFDSVGEYFEELKVEDVKEILKDYYKRNKSLKEIGDILGEKIQTRELRRNFPKINTKLKCKHDGEYLYVELPNKQTYQKTGLKEEVPFCCVPSMGADSRVKVPNSEGSSSC
ncbi:hypothetical protein, partial [Amphibacillus indicireducens]|uniref:helix-turn-helix domain-containing protein n=1 Tax=Amphibacillus indicireducens TaxID=1076330 RepID=UPI0031F01228